MDIAHIFLSFMRKRGQMGKVFHGTRLKEVRAKRNLTQKQLSEITNIGQDQISRYEKGQVMNENTIRELCRALDVSADYFLGLVEDE